MSSDSIDELEQWRDIPGYEGFYQISNWGRVKSKSRLIAKSNGTRRCPERMLRQFATKTGYIHVLLYKSKEQKRFYVHNLVLTVFVGPRPEGMEACHFPDESHSNNRLDNLRWDTHKNNKQDSVTLGTSNKGERHGMSKLTKEDVLEIRRLRTQGMLMKDIAPIYGVGEGAISSVCRKITWGWLP